MIPEFGHFALWLAFGLSLAGAILPMVGSLTGRVVLQASARPISIVLCLLLTISYLCLSVAFLNDDFSVAYVANNSSELLPWYFKLTAVWGSHEGSILFQTWTLSVWVAAVALFSNSLTHVARARVLAVLAMIVFAFIAFTLFTSNPFERLIPFAPEHGADLNPLLQDWGMIIHPPLLYIGYVGFAVAFAFAIAALIDGRLDSAWARWARPWVLAAWLFLTLGITIGSWWAYAELGWGGWWFWDPVENASLMPWFIGTALLHSLAVTEQRLAFRSWTLLLSLLAFILSLMGSFLVRSGVLTSVHAFATDPERGFFLLVILAVIVGASLILYAFRAPTVKSFARYDYKSKEFALLINNILLVVVTFIVLLGTLFPLVADWLKLGKISIGAPFFNQSVIPVMLVLSLLLPMGPLMRWKSTSMGRVAKLLTPAAIAAVVLSVVVVMAYGWSWGALVGWLAGLWIFFGTLVEINQRLRNKGVKGMAKLKLSFYGMVLGHIGMAVTIIGIAMTSIYSVEDDVRMGVGSSHTLANYEFKLEEFRSINGQNYRATVADIAIYKNGKYVKTVTPEKRRYLASGQVMTEAAIDVGVFRDLHVALGEQLKDGDWAVRLQVKPFMRWVWGGGIIMALGGLLSLSDRRYRQKGKKGLSHA